MTERDVRARSLTHIGKQREGRAVRDRAALAFLVASILVASAAIVVSPASAAVTGPAATAGAPWLQPADGVFTCEWIDAHVAAARHWHVSCSGIPAGADASDTASGDGGGITPLANDCQWIPSMTTYIGGGVFTWTSYEYSNYWSWTEYVNPYTDVWSAFHWYIQRTDGTSVANGASSVGATSGNIGVVANNYRWGAQNTGGSGEQFFACYSD